MLIFGGKLDLLVRLGRWDRRLEKAVPAQRAEEARIPKGLSF